MTGTSTLTQPYIFLSAVYGGLLIGIVYDMLRIVRWALGSGKFVNAVFDGVFWLAAVFVMLVVLFAATAGVPRFFAFVGFSLGFAIYMAGLGKLVMSLLKAVKNVFVRIYTVISSKIKEIAKKHTDEEGFSNVRDE